MSCLDRLFRSEKGSYSLARVVGLAPHSPPILKRSKVEMTACSGLSDPLSRPDSESLSLRVLWESVLTFLDNGGLGSEWCAIRDLSRREGYGGRATSRRAIQQDPKENIKLLVTGLGRVRAVATVKLSKTFEDVAECGQVQNF